MASTLAVLTTSVLLIIVAPTPVLLQKDYFIVAPNVFRLGVEETVAINIFGIANPVNVSVFLQTFPTRTFTFSPKIVKVENGKPAATTVIVKPKDIPETLNINEKTKFHVYLVVKCTTSELTFSKESVVLVTPQGGYIFVQTDKPIYTPRQSVRIRVIALDQDLTLMKSPFRVRIINPQKVVVQRDDYNEASGNGIITLIYKFPGIALIGLWGVSVEYGHEFSLSTFVSFEVKKYVLPTFDVKIEMPKTIMENDDVIELQVVARYVYGKVVRGVARLRYGIKIGKDDVSYIPDNTTVEIKKLVGDAEFSIPMKMITDKFGGFPDGHNFYVEATVIEGASGKEFSRIAEYSYFQKHKYMINFKKTSHNFKPSLIFRIQVQILFTSKDPAPDLTVVFTVKTDDGSIVPIVNNHRKTDKSGYAQVHLSVSNTTRLDVEVVTKDSDLSEDQQSKGKHVMFPYTSVNNVYLGISYLNAGTKLQIGSQFDGRVIIRRAEKIDRIMFAVISRGKVLVTGTAGRNGNKAVERTITFKVTIEMIPSIRVVVFTNSDGHLIADSMWMDVEDSCRHGVELEITPLFAANAPGESGKVVIKAAKNTTVALLAVDKAVYILRNEGRLTSDKVYKTMEGYDIGCGVGGGKNTANLLEKSGIIILTSSSFNNEKRDNIKCNDLMRQKRELDAHADQYTDPFIRSCCTMAQMPTKIQSTCLNRTSVLKALLIEKYPDKVACADAFFNCCMATNTALSRSGVNYEQLGFVMDKDLESKENPLQTRSLFAESWLYDEVKMRDTTKEYSTRLEHTITTWVFQALSVSQTHGLCVAKPKEIVSFKSMFLDVNVPYSVVRHEEIEIKVTVFNYLKTNRPVTLYMYGVKGLCTGAQPGQRTDRKRIVVPMMDAISTGFFIMPLEVGKFKLRFVALSEFGTDVVEKDLNVRTEGKLQTKDYAAKIDPDSDKRIRRPGDHRKQQYFNISVLAPNYVIPETESATINIIGDSFGPTVETAFRKNELAHYIQKPFGCGEQNMMLTAPMLYTMKYLTATGRLDDKVEKEGYNYIRFGYQSQLNYRTKDGGFAVYANRPTNMWLTAFVMKCFCQANSLIKIDKKVLCTALRILVKAQQKDGSFILNDKIIHTVMVGGLKGAFTMTAFALISLSACDTIMCDVPDIDKIKDQAMGYLEKGIDTKKRPYELAVAVYALTLVKSLKHMEAVKLLKDASIYNADLDQRNWEKGDKALSIEATGYGLLTFVLLDDLSYAKAIVNYLNAKRNFGGVWKSTQDTVIALQAMAEYAIKARQPKINLAINITSETDAKFFRSLAINSDNVQVLQSINVRKPGGALFFNAYGDGTAQVYVQLRYNIPVPPKETCAFNLTIKSEEVDETVVPNTFARIRDLDSIAEHIQSAVGIKTQADILKELAVSDKDDRQKKAVKKLLKITVCTRFKGPAEQTAMAIIDVGLFTGYTILADDLDKLLKENGSNVQQYEASTRGMIFYLDSISSKKETCLEFRAQQIFKVGATEQAAVTVYDYYEPELTCTAFYEPGQASVIKKRLCAGNKACMCPRGGCTTCTALHDLTITSQNVLKNATRELLDQACNQHNYVWLVTVKNIKFEDKSKLIDVVIEDVIKPGVEGADEGLVKGARRTLYAFKHCKCPKLNLDNKYIIMGQDGTKWESKGVAKFKYLVNPTTKIYPFKRIKDTQSKDREAMKAINWLMRRFLIRKRRCEGV